MTAEYKLDLTSKDWKKEPAIPLIEFGQILGKINITFSKRKLSFPNDPILKERLRKLRILEKPETFYSGPLASVDKINIEPEKYVNVETSETDFFEYLVLHHHFGKEKMGEECPVKVLAIHSLFLTPKNDVFFYVRNPKITDMPGTWSELGGSLKPDQTDAIQAVIDTVDSKVNRLIRTAYKGLDLDVEPSFSVNRNQITASGIVLDNVNAVPHLDFLIRLDEQQSENLKALYLKIRRDFTNIRPGDINKDCDIYYWINAEKGYIEKLLQHQNILKWNPPAVYNLLNGLVCAGLRTPEEAKIMEFTVNKVLIQGNREFTYTYPIEKLGVL